ncbi:MAG TPA: ribosome assembly RNA-binding protein YhbY [Burkholderiaceae bacterium]|nr:ribosome assembly RNA-binding protein YhbY [Burkholderiaceae bacterium]
MSELKLLRDLRLQLKARAHALDPVVLLGAHGLTEAVIKEVDRALNAHELIKVRVPDDDRAARETVFAELADRLAAARVQMIGKLLVLFRPRPEEAPPAPAMPVRRSPAPARRMQAGRERDGPRRKPAKATAKPATAKTPTRAARRDAGPAPGRRVRRPTGRSRSS